MPRFPTKESQVLALASQVIAGCAAHPGDFPNVNRIVLRAKRNIYESAKKTQIDAISQNRLATVSKNKSLQELVKLMRSYLRISEVDVSVEPDKLTYIGWGPKATAQPVAIPDQPTNLHPIAEGPGDIWLQWDRPASGGIVRNYVIERRQQPVGSGDFGLWEVVGTSLNNQIHLQDQPRGIQIEYRVKAINTAGESPPSNAAEVVL